MLPGKRRADLQKDAEQFVLGDHELDEEERGQNGYTDDGADVDRQRLVDGSNGGNGEYSLNLEDGDDMLDEKIYRFMPDLPNPNQLINAKRRIPGTFSVASYVRTKLPYCHELIRANCKVDSHCWYVLAIYWLGYVHPLHATVMLQK